MSKPYLVVNIVEGDLGSIYECPNYSDAVEKAVELAKKQFDTAEDEIREDLENEGYTSNWRTPGQNQIKIYLAMAEE